jgi:hypothetical protein
MGDFKKLYEGGEKLFHGKKLPAFASSYPFFTAP